MRLRQRWERLCKVRQIRITNFVAITITLASYYFTADPVIALLNLSNDSVEAWAKTLYVVPFGVGAFWVCHKFITKR